jgi:small-conductance mechanosensitive channel
MSDKPIGIGRRVFGLILMLLGILFWARINQLCWLHWSEHYGEESRNRMALWFWLSLAIAAAGYALAMRSRVARRLALLLVVFGFISLFTYQYVFDPPVVPY